jgi:hypothetical protein
MPRQEGSQTQERPGASLLVRCWLEPRNSDESPILRGYLKNLRTGEEHFIKDLDSVGQQILRSLTNADAASPVASEELGRSGVVR